MKRVLAFVISTIVLACGVPLLGQTIRTESFQGRDVVAGEVIVRFRNPGVVPDSPVIAQDPSISSAEGVGRTGAIVLRSGNRSVDNLVQSFAGRPDVLYAEPNYILHKTDIPNDPSFGLQWGLRNTGQVINGRTGTPNADIYAVDAWNTTTGSPGIVVAVTDTGIDLTHPDLSPNIWTASNAFDLNVMGLAVHCGSGTHGFNAITGSCNPSDDEGHGTHVGGIIGAVGNNGIGVSGINRVSTILPLKFLDSTGSGSTTNAIKAIEFAIQLKLTLGVNIRVLNASWSGGGFSSALRDEINAAGSNDMLFVASAGNSGLNIDFSPSYPASYNLANEIAVASTQNQDGLSSFSNYGAASVVLGAPGEDIASTYIGGSYVYLSGTSMAAPMVSGAAALILSACSLDTAALRSNVTANVDQISSLAGRTVTGGRLNVGRAVGACAGSTIPISVQTNPPGLQISVDGSTLTSPQNFNWISGSNHTIGTFSPQGSNVFLSWSDGGGIFHSVAPTGPTTYTANFSSGSAPDMTITKSHVGNFTRGQIGATYSIVASNVGAAPSSSTVTVTESVPAGLIPTFISGSGWNCAQPSGPCNRSDVLNAGQSYPAITLTVNIADDAIPLTNVVSVSGGGQSNTSNDTASDPTTITVALQFVPVSPCRVIDTRGPSGPLGGPFIAAGVVRAVPVLLSACGLPGTAVAYSFNVTVVPRSGALGYLTVWPAGQTQPNVSTLNSPDGSILANAAVVAAGTGGAIDVFASNDTELIIDVNGYFAPPTGGSLQFYSLTPCRVMDTRNPTGTFGGPALAGGTSRTLPVQSSSCGVPSTATSYSFNITVVPHTALNYLTAWPAGQSQPFVSTLNSLDGSILANAAIVPGGTNGDVSFFATGATDLIVDINGYFAPPGSGGLNFYPVVPCRVADTRGPTGPLGGPALTGGSSRTYPAPASACALPASAAGYSLNMTVVPSGPLSYLTLWPTGQTQPFVSTLNAPKGQIVANAAIVPAGSGGSVDVFVSDPTHVIIDTNGYFAP